MSAADLALDADDYDEFAFLEDIAEEWALPWSGRPQATRREVEIAPGRAMSALVWGAGAPELVFLHGGAQNAHTWDTVMLALNRPAVAFDLLSHGHSARLAPGVAGMEQNVEALEIAISALAPQAKAVIGMSFGGTTTIRLTALRPDLARKAVIIDVTPQVLDAVQAMSRADRGTTALTSGPSTYASFEEMAQAAIALSPHRSAQSVRRGVRHNAKRLPDGRWAWRYDMRAPDGAPPTPGNNFMALWDDVSAISVPTMLVLGGESKFVAPEHVAEFRRRMPSVRVETVAGAGHAVQSDRPLDLRRLIEDFVFA